MSYKRKAATVTVKFSGDYEGLEVVMKALKIKTFRQLIPVMTKFENVDENDPTAMIDLTDELSGIINEYAVSWNMVDDDDNPVPLSELAEEDVNLVMGLFAGWTQGMAGVDQDLGKDLTSGETSPTPSLQMELL